MQVGRMTEDTQLQSLKEEEGGGWGGERQSRDQGKRLL